MLESLVLQRFAGFSYSPDLRFGRCLVLVRRPSVNYSGNGIHLA